MYLCIEIAVYVVGEGSAVFIFSRDIIWTIDVIHVNHTKYVDRY